MPYRNLPEEQWPKMDRCVEDVMSKDPSLDKESAIAICHTSITGKAQANSPLNLIVGHIHQSYTVACDELFLRGYMTQDERMAIGALIGQLLTDFRNRLIAEIPTLASSIVDAEDVEEIVEKYSAKQHKSVIEQMIDQVLAPFKQKQQSDKAGARHSALDSQMLQQIHDHSVELGASCPMLVFKESNGRLRWVTFSSTAYEDRDGEIVSQKAQEEDCDYLEKTGDYGVLRWWHVGDPKPASTGYKSWKAGKGIDLGKCDFSAMHNRVRVESGTFYDDRVGARVKEIAPLLSVSLGFSHPDNEPDSTGGIFENIHSFERSLLPRGKQSNYFASVPVIAKETTAMKETKLNKFKELMGGLAELVLGQAEQTDKEAQAAGVAFKQATGDEQKAAEDKPAGIGAMTEAELKGFIQKCMDEFGKSTKEAESEATEKAIGALEVTLKQLQTNDQKIAGALDQIVKLQQEQGKSIKALEGELPRSLKQMARSNADDNLTSEDEAKKKGPAQKSADSSGFDFFDWISDAPKATVPNG